MNEINKTRQRIAKLEAGLGACLDLQADLINTKLMLETILNGISEGVLLISKNFKIVWANKALLESSGCKTEEIIGNYCYKITHHKNSPCIAPHDICPIKRMMKTRKTITVVHKHFDKQGSVRFVEVTAYPVRNKRGKVLQFIHISKDITERIEREQQKSTFVANVAHEIKNPLTVIGESLNIVLEGIAGKLNSEQKRILESGKRGIERLTRLVINLLDISLIESGKIKIQKEKIDIKSFVNSILNDYEREIRKRKLVLKTYIPKDIGTLLADKDKLEQVIINILNNAIKYTSIGGSITLRLLRTKGKVQFEISDTGRGIVKKNLGKLFNKFERIMAEKGEGTGLGLFISKSIIELHKGNIWVESEPGKGSKFYFTLPV